MALERVALAMIREPLRAYQRMVQTPGIHVPNWIVQSIPTGKAYRTLCDYRNIIFHVKTANYNPDKIESEWLKYTERYPTIDIIFGLLMFFSSWKEIDEVRTPATGDGSV